MSSSESSGSDSDNEVDSDLDVDDDFSDHSFGSETDSENESSTEMATQSQDTCSTMHSIDSQRSCTDEGDFWSSDMHDVEIGEFTEETGPSHELFPADDIINFFFLLFEEYFFSHLVKQTNLYARQRGEIDPDPHWHDTNIPEMMAFIGLHIFMGVNQLPRAKMYWSKNPFLGNKGFQETLTKLRFDKLQQYLHLNDNSTQGMLGSENYDRLHKIRPLLDMTRKNFQMYYKPGKYQAVDEGMVRYKGRFYAKQFMPAKPIKRGLKIWMRCETSGYCGDYRPYLGKHDVFQGRGLGERVVRHLCRPLKWKNHVVFFDRFFTSINLIRTLEVNGIYACGTIRATAEGIPPSLVSPKLERGDTLQEQHGNLVITAWKDRQLVHVLSNSVSPVGDDPVVRRVPRGRVLEITRPPPVSQYQKYMGGVDRCMQHRAKNPVGRSSKKYWKFLFNFILEICLVNSYILWKETPDVTPPRQQYSLLDFRCDIAEKLIGNYRKRAKEQNKTRSLHSCERLARKRSSCKWCPKHGQKRRKETVYGCGKCNVHLCKDGCFDQYHKQFHPK